MIERCLIEATGTDHMYLPQVPRIGTDLIKIGFSEIDSTRSSQPQLLSFSKVSSHPLPSYRLQTFGKSVAPQCNPKQGAPSFASSLLPRFCTLSHSLYLLQWTPFHFFARSAQKNPISATYLISSPTFPPRATCINARMPNYGATTMLRFATSLKNTMRGTRQIELNTCWPSVWLRKTPKGPGVNHDSQEAVRQSSRRKGVSRSQGGQARNCNDRLPSQSYKIL